MATLFISRHVGAMDWLKNQGISIDRTFSIFTESLVNEGDTVIGAFDIATALKVIEQGANYVHLKLDVPEELKGKELTEEEIVSCDAQLLKLDITSQPFTTS